MAASLSLTQLSSGNPVYDKFYRQVDPSGSGRVAAADAALFLKRSGLADLVLGKIWDLADSDRKGCLNKQQFFIALRLVACAQNGLEVALKSLNLAVPPPKFHDTSSPQLPGGVAIDGPWVVKAEEKLKFDAIFDSLSPTGGMLTGEKVKPVLLNSKLPVDVLGRVWELSDLDRDGMLDRDEFAVAMYLVYRALEGEPVPMSLPPPLVPPSKRKKPSMPPPVMPLLPSPPSLKDRSSHSGTKTLPPPPPKTTAAVGTSLTLPPKTAAPPVGTSLTLPPKTAVPTWVVSPADKAKYDEVFVKTDGDMDGLVSGPEVRDIFLKTGLPSATLARIWELCDIGDIGKLTREQFALALHLINQKLTKGLDPPQTLPLEMIPPSDRLLAKQNNLVNLAADFSAIKELDSLSNEIVELQREKSSVEQEIKEKEESVRQRTSEVQDLQEEVSREGGELQRLQTQRQEVQEALEELDQQKSSLEEQLAHIRLKCSHENQLISSLQAEQAEQEEQIIQYEEQLVAAREELLGLQEETAQLELRVEAAREQLTPLQQSVRESFSQVSQVNQKLGELQQEERSLTAQLSWKTHLEDGPALVNGSGGLTGVLHQGDLRQGALHQGDLRQGDLHQWALHQGALHQGALHQGALHQGALHQGDLRQGDLHQWALHQGDLHQGDRPADLREEPAAADQPRMEEPSEQQQKEEAKEEEEEEEEEKEERPKSPEESKPDVFEDLYSSLSTVGWPQDNLAWEQASPTAEVLSEVKEEDSPRASTPKVAPPEQERRAEAEETPQEPPKTSPPSLPPQITAPSLPPQTTPPALPELDFFHGDPFTDHDPFKDDPFGKSNVTADPFGSDPFKGSDPFAADSFFKQSSSVPFPAEDPFSSGAGLTEPGLFAAQPNNTPPASSGPDPFQTSKPSTVVAPPPVQDPFGTQASVMADADPFGTQMDTLAKGDPFGSQGNMGSDPFSCSPAGSELLSKDLAAAGNDPFAPGGTVVNTDSDPDPFAAVFGNESFGGGFADFSALAKSNGSDPFSSSSPHNKNLFQDESPSPGSDVPPALPPKTGTPTRPPPPPPGKRSSINRSESSDSFHRRGPFLPSGSGGDLSSSSSSSSSQPAKDGAVDPFAPSSPRHNARTTHPDRFASFDKYPTEEDMIEWAKRESEREEKERLARLSQQEQEDLELAIALSKSQLS